MDLSKPDGETLANQPTRARSLISKWLSIALPLILGFSLIIYKYQQFTPAQIREMQGYFKSADYFYIAVSLFIALLGYLSRAYRWKFSLNHMGYSLRFSNSLMAVCISYFVNLTIPRSGEISRAVIVKKYESIPFDKAFGTIVAERIVDFLIFLLFVAISLIFQFDVLRNFVNEHIPLEQLAMIAIGGAIFMLVLILVWVYSKWRLVETLKVKVAGLREGVESVFRMKERWAFLFHSFFIWLSYLAMFHITIYALAETREIGFGAVITAFVFGSLAIGFTNSGFGAYPLLIAQIFLLYGVPDTAGTAFGWLVWISQTLLMVFLGLISFILLPILNRNK